jgi:hypothetical protein
MGIWNDSDCGKFLPDMARKTNMICSQCSEATTTEHDEIDGGVVQYRCSWIISSQLFPGDSYGSVEK